MVDTPVVTNTNTVAAVAPVVAVQAAPVVQAVQVAPIVETVPSTPQEVPTAVTPAVEAVPVAEVAPTATVLAEAIDKTVTPPVVETVPKTEDVTPPPQEGDKKLEEGQSEEPAPPVAPVYESFTLPEGVNLDEGRLKEFTGILSELELDGKADHAAVQAFGQKAVDFHVQEVTKAVEDYTKLLQTSWDRQKTEWKDSFLKDPDIGGNRFQTTVDSALTFLRTHGGTADQQKEFRNLMETSGLGNHPAMIRLLANAGRAMQEGKPLAATNPLPTPTKSKTATLYGSKTLK